MKKRKNYDDTKYRIKINIEFELYSPWDHDWNMRLEAIVIKNTIACGASHKSFMYNGNYYATESGPGPKARTRLLPKFYSEMDELLKEAKYVTNEEKPNVLGYIVSALNASKHRSDFLRLFPEALHEIIKKVVGDNFRNEGMTDEEVEQFKEKHSHRLAMMRSRMAANMLY